jgi:phosphoglycerate dehydrogenase-like enzyme
MTWRVAVLDDYQNTALGHADWSALPVGAEVTVFTGHIADTDALVEALRPFDVVVAMRERTPFTAERLERLPDLRLLITTGMANASIDLAAAGKRGVTVCGTRGLAAGTTELTWGLILSLARRIPYEDQNLRAGGWQQTIGADLRDSTLGVVGLGRLGSAVARVGLAFGMDVIAWSQNLTDEQARQAGVERVAKDELLSHADFVTVHYKLSERSTGLIGAAELDLMKPTAYLINTSRGPIVDTGALLAALRDGAIAGAGLDVFDIEPLPDDHPLRSAPNTVLTPHLGYVTEQNYRIFYSDAVADIVAFAQGNPTRVIGI